MTARNTPPKTIWTALRRLYACNKTQLAARLGVTSRTLRRWEDGETTPPPDAQDKARALLQTGLSPVWPITEQKQDSREQ